MRGKQFASLNVDSLNRWLTLIANLGIVAGLVLVAFQLEQASRFADAQQTNTEFAFTLDVYDVALGEAFPDIWARAQNNAEDLTQSEVSLVDTYLQRAIAAQILEHVQSTRGIGSDRHDVQGEAQIFVGRFLGNETALRWWQLRRKQYEPLIPSFVAAVDLIVSERGSQLRSLHLRENRVVSSGPFPFGIE